MKKKKKKIASFGRSFIPQLHARERYIEGASRGSCDITLLISWGIRRAEKSLSNEGVKITPAGMNVECTGERGCGGNIECGASKNGQSWREWKGAPPQPTLLHRSTRGEGEDATRTTNRVIFLASVGEYQRHCLRSAWPPLRRTNDQQSIWIKLIFAHTHTPLYNSATITLDAV